MLRGFLQGRVAGAGFVVLAACIALAVATVGAMAAADEYELKKAFGPDGTESSGFSSAGSVAVDQEANVIYVIDESSGRLHRFDLEGNPAPFAGSASYIEGNEIKELGFFAGEAQTQVAVDSGSHEFYVSSNNSVTAFQFDGEPALFGAGPGAGTNAIGGFTRLLGLAVDASGAVYAADRDAGIVKIFDSSGELITQFSAQEAGTLGVDGNGVVYVNRRFNLETVLKFTPSTFPVTNTTTYTAASQPLSPESSRTLALDRTTNEVYVAHSSNPKIAIYDENSNLVLSFAAAGEDGAVDRPLGVAVDEATGDVFVADEPSGAGLAQVKIFGPKVCPQGPPTVSTSVIQVTADSAELQAQINPQCFETSYYFEYGLSACAVGPCQKVPLEPGVISAGEDPIAVFERIFGLEAETVYHFRVVAENKEGITSSQDRTFTTQVPALDFELPDQRAWEMVSPLDKNGALIEGLQLGHIQAAVDGNGLAYLTRFDSIEEDPDGSRPPEASSVIARRGEAGWASEDITPPNSRVVPYIPGAQSEYKLFAPDLSKALLEPRSGTPLSPESSGPTPYWRQNTQPPIYRPLLTVKEGFANVPAGTDTGGSEIKAATPDLDHVVLKSIPPLVAGAPEPSLYRWYNGQLEIVSILPDAEGGMPAAAEKFVGSGSRSVRHAISDNGSRVFWTSSSPQRLYVRDLVTDEAGRIDLVQPGASGSGISNPVFQGASGDGGFVFFTDSRQLTEDASPSGADLYRCELPLSGPVLGCANLLNLSAPLAGSGESAQVQGMVSALSDDGSRLYFVAKGALDTGANQVGDSAQPDQPNLYLWHQGEGVRFIATLSMEDDANWGMAGTVPAPGQVASLSAASSPSGRYFAFMSERSLTGEDNLEAATSVPVERVFRYDAESDRLDCISCDPTGAAPQGRIVPQADQARRETSLIDPRAQWEERLVAAILPEPTIIAVEATSLYRPRAVQDNGRVFFNAFDSLVPADSNEQWDVYQHEPTGLGTCSALSSDAGTSRSGDGCVSLLSSGTANGPAAFFDASANGDDVFFFTPTKLSVTDEDEQADIYDARVDGLTAKLQPPSNCVGEACRPLPLMPGEPTPGSATFLGSGNLKHAGKRCPKGKRKVRRNGRLRCVPRKHRKSQRHRRAGQSKRAGR
jgi:DNA-binding beta-propeller fold protein YncE